VATITKKIGEFGDTSLLGQVRIKPFKPTAMTVRITAEVDEKAARAKILEWADALEKKLRKQRATGAISADLTQMTVNDLLDGYLADTETQALGSFASLVGRLAWWREYCGTTKVLRVEPRMLHAARTKLQTTGRGRSRLQKGRKASTCNRHLAALRSAWSWARASGVIPLDLIVFPQRLFLKEPDGRVRFLSDDELARLQAAAKPDPVMYAAIMVAVGTGLRRGEILRLVWKDIDFAASILTVNVSKNGKKRQVHLTASTVDALKALRQLPVVSTTHVFMQEHGVALNRNPFERRWRAIREAAHLEDFRFHDCRHSCASILAQSGASLWQISEQLGHKSLAMSARYAHLIQGKPTAAHAALEAKLRGT
jgi:integrase